MAGPGIVRGPFGSRSKFTVGWVVLSLVFIVLVTPFWTDAGPTSRSGDDLYVAGWTFPWDMSTIESLEGWDGVIDDISPYWYWVLPNGSLVATHNETEDPDVLHYCIDNDIGLIPMISNNHNTATVMNLLYNSTIQTQHIQDLITTARRLLFKGVDINYEEIPAAEKNGFTNFIRNLTVEFHNYGKEVHVSVFPKVSADEVREGPGAYDYEVLGQIADRIRVMAYNLHWSTAPTAGPVTSIDWLQTVMGYASTAIPKEKCLLGIAQYGYNWRVNRKGNTIGVADNVTYPDIISLKKEYNLQRKWNSTSRTPYFEYKDRDGYLRSMHYCDSESLMHQLRLIGDLSINGISVWKIGNEDPDVSFFLREVKKTGLDDLPPFIDMGGDLTGMRGTDIDFGPIRAYDIETTLDSIHWDFGDGKVSELLEPVHRYERGGFYTATLTLSDTKGSTLLLSRNVKIGPHAYFDVEGEIQEGSAILFNGTGSWDPDAIVSYSWNLGDGTYLFHASKVVTHTYSRPGSYNISLTIINTNGFSDTSYVWIDVPDIQPPKSDCGGDKEIWEGSELVLDGTGSTDNGNIANYTWDIPGIGIFYGPIIKLWMDEPGEFIGSLTVIDDALLGSVDEFRIKVKDRTAPQIMIEYDRTVILGSNVDITINGTTDNVALGNITWDLGQGNLIYGVKWISFKPEDAGRYYITIDVLDVQGNWNSTTIYVDVVDRSLPYGSYHIDPNPRELNGSYIPHVLPEGLDLFEDLDGVILYNTTYIFSLVNATDDSGIANITWWFGDGERAGGPVVYHWYADPGIYQIMLTIEDIWGNQYNENITLLAIVSWNQSVNEIWTYIDVYINNTIYVEPPEDPDDGPVIDLTPLLISFAIAVMLIISILTLVGLVKSFAGEKGGIDIRDMMDEEADGR